MSYPSDEFGELKGKVKSIFLLTNEDGNYLIDVGEDLRLIERFFYQFKCVLK